MGLRRRQRRVLLAQNVTGPSGSVKWRQPENTEWPQRGWINIGLISKHDFQQFNSRRSNFGRIRAVLHGETGPLLEFCCREDVDAFTAALQEAANAGFRAPNRATDSCHKPALE